MARLADIITGSGMPSFLLSNLNFAHLKKKNFVFCTFFAIKKIDQKANKWALFSVSRRDIRVH